eukprot:1140612-Pelagomonas_calceolata.AAC.4
MLVWYPEHKSKHTEVAWPDCKWKNEDKGAREIRSHTEATAWAGIVIPCLILLFALASGHQAKAGEQRMPAQSMSDPQRASDEHIDRVIPTGELRIPAQSMSDSLSVGDA